MSPSLFHFLYPSNVVSIFFSNAMDLLHLVPLLEDLARKVVIPHFWNDNKLKLALQKYDLWSGHALVGGIFQKSQLIRKHELLVMYDSLQKLFASQNSRIMRSTLQTTTRALGYQLQERVKHIGYAILDMLVLSNIDYTNKIGEEVVVGVSP